MPAPYPLILSPPGDYRNLFEYQAINMTAVHNTFIQGINSIAFHAPQVSGKKVKPFVFFCLVIIEHLHHHHSIEETFLFPEFERKLGEGTLSKNVEQHGDFVPQMEEFEVYLKDVQSGKLAYDGKDLIAKMQTFTDEMIEHLSDEIKTLDASRMRAAFTEKQLKDIDAGLTKIALKSVDFYTTMPFTVICRNPATPWFPTFPAPLKWATRWWFSWRHRAAWEFGPLDFSGRPREWYADAMA